MRTLRISFLDTSSGIPIFLFGSTHHHLIYIYETERDYTDRYTMCETERDIQIDRYTCERPLGTQ
jgi:hypothetical protein